MSDTETTGKHFNLDMTVADAMGAHPRAREVLAAFRLGGCAHCHLGQVETLGQICEGYGIESDAILEALEGLFDKEEQAAE